MIQPKVKSHFPNSKSVTSVIGWYCFHSLGTLFTKTKINRTKQQQKMHFFSKFCVCLCLCLWIHFFTLFSLMDPCVSFLTVYKSHIFLGLNLKLFTISISQYISNDAIKSEYKVLRIRKRVLAHLLQYSDHKQQDTFLLISLYMNINSSEWEFYYNLTFMKCNKLHIYLPFQIALFVLCVCERGEDKSKSSDKSIILWVVVKTWHSVVTASGRSLEFFCSLLLYIA
jgi:hypothetical protein